MQIEFCKNLLFVIAFFLKFIQVLWLYTLYTIYTIFTIYIISEKSVPMKYIYIFITINIKVYVANQLKY